MNRLPYATALISIVVAVGLWLIATWLEGDSDWLTPRPETASEMTNAAVRPDSPVQTDVVAASCDQVEDAFHRVPDVGGQSRNYGAAARISQLRAQLPVSRLLRLPDRQHGAPGRMPQQSMHRRIAVKRDSRRGNSGLSRHRSPTVAAVVPGTCAWTASKSRAGNTEHIRLFKGEERLSFEALFGLLQHVRPRCRLAACSTGLNAQILSTWPV